MSSKGTSVVGPVHIRSDSGPEFVAKVVQEWIGAVGAKTVYITPGSSWKNGFIESRPHTALGWLTPHEFALAAVQRAAE